MNSTQNKKIGQVKETTMIVGIDVGSEKHYFRAFNWRGIELTRKPVPFSNSMEGFNSFYNTIVELMQENKLEEAMVGIEPTGHYWFDLGQFMGEKDIKFVMVNPHHVHKTKELDDNSPSKNDVFCSILLNAKNDGDFSFSSFFEFAFVATIFSFNLKLNTLFDMSA